MSNSSKLVLLIFLILFLPRLTTGSLEDKSNISNCLKKLSSCSRTTPTIPNIHTQELKISSPPIAYISENYSDYGEDLNGDLLIDDR
jgi:hypothetical protein